MLIFYRLARVLGTRNEGEEEGSRRDAYRLNRDAFNQAPRKTDRDAAAGPDLRLVGDAKEAEAVAIEEAPLEIAGRGLAYLRDIDPEFDERGFLDGAQRAYEMIIQAFASDDKDTLRELLAPDVADSFIAVIEGREANGLRMQTEILDMRTPTISDVLVGEGRLRILVDYKVKLVTEIIDANGTVVEGGDGARVSDDRWTFERPLDASQSWLLAATEQPETA